MVYHPILNVIFSYGFALILAISFLFFESFNNFLESLEGPILLLFTKSSLLYMFFIWFYVVIIYKVFH